MNTSGRLGQVSLTITEQFTYSCHVGVSGPTRNARCRQSTPHRSIPHREKPRLNLKFFPQAKNKMSNQVEMTNSTAVSSNKHWILVWSASSLFLSARRDKVIIHGADLPSSACSDSSLRVTKPELCRRDYKTVKFKSVSTISTIHATSPPCNGECLCACKIGLRRVKNKVIF